MKIVTFLLKNADFPKRVVDFPREKDTFRNKIMEIVEDFDEKSYNNNGKPWKSSRILRVNPIFLNFLSFFIIFLNFFFKKISFFSFFIFFRFFIFFFIFSFLKKLLFIFFHFLSCSFMFFHVLSCSFIFFYFLLFFSHFLSFSFSLSGAQNLIFLGLKYRHDFS